MTDRPTTYDAPGAELAIEARDLRREFRSRESGLVVAVDGVSLPVVRGSVFGLIGPDGAGKSTLIRMLTTVLAPSSGDALVFGESVVSRPQAVKPRIGYMSQQFSLYGDLTVRENLDFFAELRGVPRREMASRAERLLDFAGLSEFGKRQAQYLSGGMKQKLALAATLISEPDLLFLDEPTTGVDPVSRREFWRIISGLHRQGITVFVATPYMDEADRCDEIAFMAEGRIILRDTPAGVKARVGGRVFEVSVSNPRAAMRAAQAQPFITGAEMSGEVLRVLIGRDYSGAEGLQGAIDTEEQLAEALSVAGFTVTSVRAVPTDLEMAFATLIPSAGSSAPSEPSSADLNDAQREAGDVIS